MPRLGSELSGDPRISVAVLDGPVDVGHPCFEGAMLEFPLGQPAFDVADAAAKHGTHVASILFGQPGSALAGIAPRCRGIVLPVFSGAGGTLNCSQIDLARAILIALEHGAHIINISGGEISQPDEANGFLGDALAKCEAAGVLVVAAAGNDGCACVHMPAAIGTVLAVGAAGRDGAPLPFSNWGAAYGASGILAPGEDIEGAASGGGTAVRTGTSFATPIVSGLAACMLADQLGRGETPNPLKVRQALIGTAIACDPRNQERCLAGRLDPAGAILELNRGRRAMSSAATMHEREPAAPGGVRPLAEDLADFTMGRPIERAAPGLGGGVAPSDCGCGCGGDKEKKKDCGCGCGGEAKAPLQKVFAIGQIGYDFGSEARRDSIKQFLPRKTELTTASLLDLLWPDEDIQPEVERVTWLLTIDQTPLYAIYPTGAFAFNGYAQILAALKAQNRPKIPGSPPPALVEPSGGKGRKKDEQPKTEDLAPEPVDLFSVAGVLSGSIRLMSGETVPILIPSARGIIWWEIKKSYDAFVARLTADPGDGTLLLRLQANPAAFYQVFSRLLGDYKNLITRKYRNLGVLGRERAINFAAMSAFTVFDYLREMIGLDLIIDDISVSNSPACRPGSECYDVQIRTFRQSDITASLRVFQFTLDVSDTIPVDIGSMATWSERPKR